MLRKYISKLIFLSITLAFFITGNAQACGSKCYSQEYTRQIDNFRKTEVLPQLLEWKTFLDNSIYDNDLALLNKCRAEARQIRKAIDKLMQQKVEPEDVSGKITRREELKESFNKLKELAISLQPIVEKYRDVITQIAVALQAKSDEWEQRKNEICESICSINGISKQNTNSLQTTSEFKCGTNLKICNKNSMQNKFHCFNKRKIAFFLLWDGTDNISESAKLGTNLALSNVENLNGDAKLISNNPNPFSEKTTISLSLRNTDNVKITVRDQRGNLITTLFDGMLDSGEHSFDFDAKKFNITTGLYFYMIESLGLNHTGKMIYLGQ